MDKYFFRIFVSVFGTVGLVFVAVAGFAVRSEIRLRAGAIRVPGTVVALEPVSGGKGSTLYKPVFEFADNDDRMHRVTGGVASSPPSHSPGDEVTVLYRPENPENAQLDTFMEAWFLPLIFGTLGTIFASIAGGCVIFALRSRRRRR